MSPQPPSRSNLTQHRDLSAGRVLLRTAWILTATARAMAMAMPMAIPAAAPNDWPQFRGPTGQGTHVRLPGQAAGQIATNLVWRVPLPGPGGSSPVVFSNSIFLTCYTGYGVPGTTGGDLAALQRHLLCLDRTDGKIVWQRPVPASMPEEAKVRDHGYASSTPAVDRQGIVAFFGKSGVHAFAPDGTPQWRADVGTKTHGWGSAASPVFHDDLVLINAGVESESLIALERATGRQRWRLGGIRESWNTPILVRTEAGATEIILAIAGKVLGVNPSSGEQLWSCNTGIGWYMVPSLVAHQDVVFCIGGRTGGALAVRQGGRGDVTAERRLWTISKGSNVSSPIYREGHLFWLHENLGIAYCADAASGRLVFEERIPDLGQVYGSPVLAGDALYAVSRNGRLVVLAAKPQFELLARMDLNDRSSFDGSPAFTGSNLLVRSDRFLYCLGAAANAEATKTP